MNKVKVFVSHCANDKAHLRDLASLKKGVDLWVDEDEMQSGDIIAERLKEGIGNCDACLFLQTRNSLDSTWCAAEVAAFWAVGKPVIIWVLDPSIVTESRFPFLAGVKTARTLGAVKEKLQSLRLSHKGDIEPLFGQVPYSRGIAALAESLSEAVTPLRQEIAGLHDRITAIAPFEENSLFGLRFHHFFDEKRAIAEVLVRKLEKTISEINEEPQGRRKVRLLLDSGTTVFPIFSMLMNRKKNRLLTESIEIVTNNLSGLAIIMRDGRRDDGDPHSRPAYKVLSVSGEPLPAFWAILPDHPEEVLARALKRPDEQHGESPLTIAVTTSNYLKSDGRSLFVRTPKHLAFKKYIMENADIIYILFPLGKMLNTTVEEMNDKLVAPQNKHNDDHLYRDLSIPFHQDRRIVFVTTRRTVHDCLCKHFLSIEGRLSDLKNECLASGCEVETIFLDSDEFSMARLCRGEVARQEELEMPHKNHRPYLRRWLRWGER